MSNTDLTTPSGPPEPFPTNGAETGPERTVLPAADERETGLPAGQAAVGAPIATASDRDSGSPRTRAVAQPDRAVDVVGDVLYESAAEPRCSCGRPSTKWPGQYCDAHHPLPGTPGPALKGGQYADHLPEIPVGGDWSAHYLGLLDRHIARLTDWLDGHRPRLKDVPLVERLLGLIEQRHTLAAKLQPAQNKNEMTDAEVQQMVRSAVQRLDLVTRTEPDISGSLLADSELRGQVLARLVGAGGAAMADELRRAADGGREDEDMEDVDLLLDDNADEVKA